MRLVHLLRKYTPSEWGGTETAVHRLCDGLNRHEVDSVIYCPRNGHAAAARDPLTEAGCRVKRYRACVPIWGLSKSQRDQLVSVGGNLVSFDLLTSLWKEPDVSVIHSHTLGRLAGIALAAARRRGVPMVVTIHGGYLDFPEELKTGFKRMARGGLDWGKLVGWLFRSRQVVASADAVVTCNPREAALLREAFPRQRVHVQPHGVPVHVYQKDQRNAAWEAFPTIRGKKILLTLGRLDPQKNQHWLVEQASAVLERHPDSLWIFAGACTNREYAQRVESAMSQSGLADRFLLTGGLPPGDPRLIGLLQAAGVMVLPSLCETFGLVILESLAAGTPVVASRTLGAESLLKDKGRSFGRLFDLSNPASFHRGLDEALRMPRPIRRQSDGELDSLLAEYDTVNLARRMKRLYRELMGNAAN